MQGDKEHRGEGDTGGQGEQGHGILGRNGKKGVQWGKGREEGQRVCEYNGKIIERRMSQIILEQNLIHKILFYI